MDQKSPEAFRTISEVADWLGVPTHVLRFWESRFSQVKPVKRAGGRRYYRPSDMELLGGIRRLLHDDGMTIRGVQKLLREKGVKHVAGMSPPLDLADAVDADNVVDLSDRRAEASETIAEAEAVAEETEEPEEKRGFPFDDDEPVTVDAVDATHEATAAPGQVATEETEDPAVENVEMAAAPVGETGAEAAPGDETEDDAAPEEDGGLDPADPLPSPEAMDFLAHDATPDTTTDDSDDESVPEAEAVDAPDAAPDETDPGDPMSSPEALDFGAHDAEPSHEFEAGTADPEPEAVIPEQEPEPEPEAPALAMPEIDADPDDDDREPGPLHAVALRGARSERVRVNTATLQALADRLDEISRRVGAGDNAGHF